MRRRHDALAEEYANKLRPLIPQARRAFGQQKQGSPARAASDRVNVLIREYDQLGGNITQLAEHLEGHISLPGLRRRLRMARAGVQLGVNDTPRFRGDRDPERVKEAVERIRQAENPTEYGHLIREAHQSGIALAAIAQELGLSYHTVWSSMRTATAA